MRVDRTIMGAFGDVIDTYRKKYLKAKSYADIKKIKEDFYNFKETYNEDFVDYCWSFIAVGRFEN